MKTSKQIQIKRGEVAEEFMKGLERMDIVTFDRSQLFEETSKYNYEHEKFKPILNEGCLIFSSVDDEKIHLFFKVQEDDGKDSRNTTRRSNKSSISKLIYALCI